MSEHIAILMVRWMSGLVTGLQNRLQRFESASDLKKPFYKHLWRGFSFFTHIFTYTFTFLIPILPKVRVPLSAMIFRLNGQKSFNHSINTTIFK